MTLHTCTFTGVDANTDLPSAAALAIDHPVIEFGILFSRTRAGVENRYPTDVTAIAARLRELYPEIKLALHVCGRAVFELVSGSPTTLETTRLFDRVQLNFAVGRVPFGIPQLEMWIAGFGKPVITQHNEANSVLWNAAPDNHQILFDESGGAGRRSTSWPKAHDRKSCGFAGGIGPETVIGDIEKISRENAGSSYWIDMEQRVRTDDFFDISKCERVCRLISS